MTNFITGLLTIIVINALFAWYNYDVWKYDVLIGQLSGFAMYAWMEFVDYMYKDKS